MPVWVVALQMAEAWGVPPWEIMEHEGSLRWMARWQTLKAAEAKARETT